MIRSALAITAAAIVAIAPASARADDKEPEAFAKVIVDEADFRTGPGVSFRVIHTAHRGETYALDGRPGSGFWLKVLLPDGRSAYVVGDEVQPFAVRADEDGAPSRPGFFSPPPLEGARGGLAIVGGILSIPVADGSISRQGYIEARPSLVLHKTISIDGFIGDALTSDGSQIIYGAAMTVYLAPSWVVSPFVSIGGGGLSVFPNSDSFVLKRQDLLVARAGGGLLMALRNRILFRIEVSNLSVFTADSYKNAQAYLGGFGVYF
jgi:hypothetical protein